MTRTTGWCRRKNWSSLTGKILYKSSVSRDLRKFAPKDVTRILNQIRMVLGEDLHSGEQLHGDFEASSNSESVSTESYMLSRATTLWS